MLGRDPYRERAEVRPRIGVMLQEGGFPSELTVSETVRLWAGWTGGMGAGEALTALATAAAWTALAGWTVRWRFPWEPQR